jgi:hypothetical protein
MTKWLARHEAADQFDAYLQWRSQLDSTSTDALKSFPAASKTPTSQPYSITSKPSLQKVSLERLVNNYGTTSFIPALHTYLKSRSDFSGLVPSESNTFNLYRHFNIPLVPISALSETPDLEATKPSIDKVRATLLAWGKSFLGNMSGCSNFDTVLIKMNGSKSRSDPMGRSPQPAVHRVMLE